MAIIKNPTTVVQQGGGGGGLDYATITWWDWSIPIDAIQDSGCTAQVTDATKLAKYLARYNVDIGYVDIQYDSQVHQFYTNDLNGYYVYLTTGLLSENGLSVTNVVEANYPSIIIEFGSVGLNIPTQHSSSIMPSEFNQLGNNGSMTNNFMFFGSDVVPKDAIRSFAFGTDFNGSSIPNNFLASCKNLDWDGIVIPNSVKAIGSGFLRNCSSYCSPITLNNNIEYIGGEFLYGCNYFSNSNAAIDLVDLPASVAASNNYSFATSNNTTPAYLTGMYIKGTYASDWQTKFPNRSSSPWRKTVITS